MQPATARCARWMRVGVGLALGWLLLAGSAEAQEPTDTRAQPADAAEKASEETALNHELLEWPAEEPAAEEPPPEAAEEVPPEKEADEPPPITVDWSMHWNNGFRLRRSDGRYDLHLGGRILVDGAVRYFDKNLVRTSQEGWDTDSDVRQGRLFGQGFLFQRCFFKASYDFANTDATDLFVGLRGLGPLGSLQVGYMKEPFSLEQRTSALFITFMERSLANALVPGRNSGILVTNTFFDDRLRLALGAFALVDSLSDTDNLSDGFDDGLDLTASFTGVLYEDAESRDLLIAGLSYSHTFVSEKSLTVGQRPESFLSDKLLQASLDNVDGARRLAYEAAWVSGPLSLQTESIFSWIHRSDSATVFFWGSYLQVSYLLTGERRIYGKKSGAFGRIVPHSPFSPSEGGWGALELAARFSYLDLDDQEIRGGREGNVTLGLNWYLLSNARISVNAIYGRVSHQGDVAFLQTRFQLVF